MSYKNVQRPNIEAMMNMFIALHELKKSQTIDQAIDSLDLYLRTGDKKYLTTENDLRERIANTDIVEYFQPIYEEGYDHLYYYLDEIAPTKRKNKIYQKRP